MKKRIISMILTMIFLFSLVSPCLNVSASGYNFKSGKEVVDYINKYIRDYYRTNYDYYPSKLNGKTINYNQVWKEWIRNSDGSGSYLLNPVVYGNSHNIKHTGFWSGYTSTAIGYDKFGNSIIPYTENFVNPYDGFFRWDVGWTGTRLAKVSKSFWNAYYSNCSNRTQTEKDTIKETRYSGSYIPDATLMEEAIQKGVDHIWGDVPAAKVTTGKYYNGTYIYDRVIHKKGEKPANGRWIDYLLIVVPPTDISWGLAWRFNGSGDTWYIINIPIAPFNMVTDDITVQYEQYASSAVPGTRVEFKAAATADSNLQNVSYSWSVKDKKGNPVSGVSYSGHSGSGANGKFNITGGRSSQHKISFTMPTEDVVVSFSVNGDKTIKEIDYTNNSAEIDPVTVRVKPEGNPINIGEFVLDYDIYALDIAKDTQMKATFPTDRGYQYFGTGSSNYYSSKSGSMTRDQSASGTKTVDGSPFTPKVTASAKLYRDGVGDDPSAKKWLPDGTYSSSEKLLLTGNAWRQYRYTYQTGKGTSKTIESRLYETFDPVGLAYNGVVKVYNGMPALSAPSISSGVSNAHLEWQSEPVKFNVTREMFEMTTDGRRINKRNVPGQYTRTFYGKNTADITWASKTSMSSAYANDRATAKKNGRNYNLAVFSTGKDFQNVAYPLKSGYMFNPAGTYICTVKSSVLVDKDASEDDKLSQHKELVESVKRSFVYNNDLVYTTNGNDTYQFKNITSANLGGILSIKETNKTTPVAIPNSQYEPCMEGYEASGTIRSYNNYRYREFASNQEVQRIDAETVITFTISSSSKKYTNVKMKDGSYNITAKSNPFTFKGMTVPQANLSDTITVKVKGSIYDDRN